MIKLLKCLRIHKLIFQIILLYHVFAVTNIAVKFATANKIHKIFFYTEEELNNLFNSSLCITESDIPDSEDDVSSTVSSENSPMALIHDLAVYNKIEYQYDMISAVGPPHNMWYTVALRLGHPEWDIRSEDFMGYGTKIKDAQRNAAKNALLKTSFPQKPIEEKVVLNDKTHCNEVEVNTPSCRLAAVVEETNKNIIYTKYRPDRSDMYGVQIYLDGDIFTGEGYTLSSAKEVAASNVLTYLYDEDSDLGVCNVDDVPNNDDDIECTALKSPVSLLHEVAQKYNYQIKFTLAGEVGPPHKKTFKMVCNMGDHETTGEGSSKKLAKLKASENMLEILSRLDYPLTFKTTHEPGKKSRKTKNNIEKSNIEERNPIKTLYEWAGVNSKGDEPMFVYEDLIGTEGGHKRFKADCVFKGFTASGYGHKKKIAKQEAALGMLNLLHIPYSDDNIKTKDPLLTESYAPGLLKSPDYMLHASYFAPELANSRASRLESLSKKLKKAANYKYVKSHEESSQLNDNMVALATTVSEQSVIEQSSVLPLALIYQEIADKNKTLPTQQLKDFLDKIGIKLQYIDLPMHSAGTFSSVVWLFVKPELVCYSRPGGTTQEAQENSALATLTFLSELTMAVNSTSQTEDMK